MAGKRGRPTAIPGVPCAALTVTVPKDFVDKIHTIANELDCPSSQVFRRWMNVVGKRSTDLEKVFDLLMVTLDFNQGLYACMKAFLDADAECDPEMSRQERRALMMALVKHLDDQFQAHYPDGFGNP